MDRAAIDHLSIMREHEGSLSKLAAQMESLQTAFEVLAGDVDKMKQTVSAIHAMTVMWTKHTDEIRASLGVMAEESKKTNERITGLEVREAATQGEAKGKNEGRSGAFSGLVAVISVLSAAASAGIAAWVAAHGQ